MLASASARGSALARAAGGGAEAARLAETAAIAHVLASLAAGGRLRRRGVERLVRRLAETEGLPPDFVGLVLHVGALREPRLLELPPDQAVEAHLRLLVGLAPIDEASLWALEPNGRLRCVLHLGARPPTRRVRAAAREALDHTSAKKKNDHGFIHAVPVLRWQHPFASLVVRTRPEDRVRALAFAEEAAATLSSALERQTLLERSAEGERNLVESSERRLARLGLDLHDGPIQELAALAGDLRLFRRQVARVVAEHEHGDIVLGRVEDLTARLVELDRELRELSRSSESSTLFSSSSFLDVLSDEVGAFSGRRKIDARLDARGRLDTLTASQRIALLRVVQEALTNVREHSSASHVSVTVFPDRTHVYVEVTDDGRGFDVERTLVQAAKRGRLGLVGMSERIRLLGGRFDIQSRRGGPTTISAMIPKWRPLEADADGGEVSGPIAAAARPRGS